MEKESKKLNIPSKEEIKEIMENPGKIKGVSLRGDLEYVLSKKGKAGLKAVEDKAKRLGFPIEYKKIKETEWYPIGFKIVSLTAILKTFNWGEKELADIAKSAPKLSFLVRFFARYFIPVNKAFQEGYPRLWLRYFNIGEIEVSDFSNNKEGGWLIVRIKNIKLHPLYCLYLSHWFLGLAKLARSGYKTTTSKETKCMFRGDPYHEYLVEWTYK